MAVRVFDQADSMAPRLTVVEPAPQRRQDVRRVRHQWMTIGVASMFVPFVISVIVLEVVH